MPYVYVWNIMRCKVLLWLLPNLFLLPFNFKELFFCQIIMNGKDGAVAHYRSATNNSVVHNKKRSVRRCLLGAPAGKQNSAASSTSMIRYHAIRCICSTCQGTWDKKNTPDSAFLLKLLTARLSESLDVIELSLPYCTTYILQTSGRLPKDSSVYSSRTYRYCRMVSQSCHSSSL